MIGPIHDKVYDHEDGTTLSHQKAMDDGFPMHRLVVCCDPPQKVGKWVNLDTLAWCEGYYADFDDGPKFSTQAK